MALTPGNWKVGTGGTVVSDQVPADYKPGSGHDEVTYYGGFLIAESIGNASDRQLIAQAKNILLIAAEVVRDVNRSDLPSVNNLKKIVSEFI